MRLSPPHHNTTPPVLRRVNDTATLKKMAESQKVDDKEIVLGRDVENHATYDDTSSLGKGDILQLEHTDPVLNAKMHLVNNAIGT